MQIFHRFQSLPQLTRTVFQSLCLALCLVLSACGGGGGDEAEQANDLAPAPAAPDPDPEPAAGDPSLASGGCTNVVIVADYAYGACGNQIEVVSLADFGRTLINVAADDIAADAELGLLFTQSQTQLSLLNLTNPAEPAVVTSATTNFSAFSGVSAANGVVVVSGGAGGSNTQVYTYTNTSLTLATNGIPSIDSATGNPDVHLSPTASGVTAFYSQDIGGVANFAIQPVAIDLSGAVTEIGADIVLAAASFGFEDAFSPANFPVESEFLDGQLFVAHFAAQGIEVIDTTDGDLNGNTRLPVIGLPYEPTNIATDGTVLFVVGLTNDTVDIIDPAAGSVTGSLSPDQPLLAPVGVAASLTFVAVADRTNGLVLISR